MNDPFEYKYTHILTVGIIAIHDVHMVNMLHFQQVDKQVSMATPNLLELRAFAS